MSQNRWPRDRADRASASLTAAIIARVRDAIQGGPPVLLSPGEAADIPCAGPPDMDAVAAALGGAPVDAIATRARGRRKGLLVADMDSTIVTSETLDELAAFAGLKDHIAAITQTRMNGELDFADALRERVGMLKGLAARRAGKDLGGDPADPRRPRTGRHHAGAQRHHRAGLRRFFVLHQPGGGGGGFPGASLQPAARRRAGLTGGSASRSSAATPSLPPCASWRRRAA